MVRFITMRRTLVTLFVSLLLCFPLLPRSARAAEEVSIVVLREHGVGSAAQAQRYLDRLVDATAEANGWKQASGKYFTSRKLAGRWIEGNEPEFGILSLPGFLAMRKPQKLRVVGMAIVEGAGGRRYHVVSNSQKSLAGCKGKSLATDHADDERFINRVVGASAFSLGDFELVETRRPLQTVKKVIRGQAECALIDDAQYGDLGNIDGGKALKSVWKSRQLPPMVVVAFPPAESAQTKRFRAKLASVCKGKGKQACEDSGIASLRPAGAGKYKAVIRRYGG